MQALDLRLTLWFMIIKNEKEEDDEIYLSDLRLRVR
jgi:hypothetical protein